MQCRSDQLACPWTRWLVRLMHLIFIIERETYIVVSYTINLNLDAWDADEASFLESIVQFTWCMMNWVTSDSLIVHKNIQSVICLHLFRQNSAAGRWFEGCLCVWSGSWSRGSYPLHPQRWGCGPACGGKGFTLSSRAEGKLSTHCYAVLMHDGAKVVRSRSHILCTRKQHRSLTWSFWAPCLI